MTQMQLTDFSLVLMAHQRPTNVKWKLRHKGSMGIEQKKKKKKERNGVGGGQIWKNIWKNRKNIIGL